MTEKKKLIIIGASGHGKVIADMATSLEYKDIFFLDDNASNRHCMEFPVVGASTDAVNFPDADFIGAIGNSIVRERIQHELSTA